MPSVTDWISAVGQAVGALATGGAFWLAAHIYNRQSKDQRRAQAAAVTLHLTENAGWGTWKALVRNDSPLPIFNVALVGVDAEGNDVKDSRHQKDYVPGTTDRGANSLPGALGKGSLKKASHVSFTDAAGTKWKRTAAGLLKEVRDYPF